MVSVDAHTDFYGFNRAGWGQPATGRRHQRDRTRRFRMYQAWVTIVDLRNVPDDVDAAVAVRMERQHVLRGGDHRFAILVEEWVLRTVIGSPGIMAGQPGHLVDAAALPSVSLGVIPTGVTRGAGWPVESFTRYDDTQVNVELVSAHLTVAQPAEIAEYGQAFSELASIAVYGPAAKSLITTAIDVLG